EPASRLAFAGAGPSRSQGEPTGRLPGAQGARRSRIRKIGVRAAPRPDLTAAPTRKLRPTGGWQASAGRCTFLPAMGTASDASAQRARRNVVLTAAIAGLGGLLFGYDTGIIAGALLFIKTDFNLGSFAQGVVVAAVPIGAIGGAAIAGPAADTYGRRLMILLSAIVFIVGALGSAAAPDLAVLVIARVVIGIAIGLASAAAPVYISEGAPPESRGRLVSFFQLAVTVGILVAYLVGLAFNGIEGWRWMLGLGCVPALALGFGMLRMPQSPRWLVMTGDDYAARAVLAKIRVDDPDTI